MKSALLFVVTAGILVLSGCTDATFPFEQVTSEFDFSYNLPEAGVVDITVLNCYMSSIRTLVSDQQQGSGQHSSSWDLLNSDEDRVEDGLYYIRVKIDDLLLETKMYEVSS